ncbi:Autotransporter adhesin [Paenibacillus terrae HPL-003]|uniref:Autotransporter adhesin n=1 Tax=Paenibacillus terrae (strain HPL-003) TaxID=985665 RepID=G7VVM2_PAETH|nr:isopeptide-forming domain-containing fimbrial protein [Paenibacillus terrae]AET57661.1 Autotransporter adhesin [Paenibacillus terrae HPL-003]
MAFIQRYVTNQTGAVTFIGNTLGLARSASAGVPGTVTSIGAFITTNTASRFGTYPFGTTSAFTSNSSTAFLVLPAGSTVLYAELIWGGSYANGSTNVLSSASNPVTFQTPALSTTVSPDSATSVNVTSLSTYVRTANVTNLVIQGGAGAYTVGNVTGTITVPDSTNTNHAGWTLAVVYNNPSLPFRNLSLRVGGEGVSSATGSVNVVVSGFATPVQGALRGRALICAQEGDVDITGDRALFGPTTSSLTALSGPNNFSTNFFASQINGDDGTLVTTGTFGTINAVNGAPGTQVTGGRQGWDITNVDISSTLLNSQTTGVLQLTTDGDIYIVNANAIQIDINAPLVTLTKMASSTGLVIGDTVTYTINISNTGLVSASNTVLTDTIPAGATFVSGSVIVAGTAQPTANPATGITVGSVAPASTVTITFRATVTSLPANAQLGNQASASFSFQTVPGGPVISGNVPSNTASTPIYQPVIRIVKSANTTAATVGDTITYTFQISNTGSIAANLSFTESIPAGSSFIPGSVTIGGSSVPSANPATGFSVGTINPNVTIPVTFRTLVNSVPASGNLTDQATYTYTFTPPDGRALNGSGTSNMLTIPVSSPNVNVTKASSLAAAAVGETVQFTITATNNGIENVTNVVVTDPLPTGVTFVPGSVTVNGTASSTATPVNGIPIGTLAPSASVTVVFQAVINSLPSPAQINNRATVSFTSGAFTGSSLSNLVIIPIVIAAPTITKSASSNRASVGGTITYSFLIANTGTAVLNTTLTETVPAGSTFIPGSVIVGGSSVPSANPGTGISVGTINPGAQITVSFRTTVNSLPPGGGLNDQGLLQYTYQLQDGRILSGSLLSNTVSVSISLPSVAVTKSASFTSVSVGETLTYSVTAVNNGIDPITNTVITDPLPGSVSFVSGSVTVGGSPVSAADPRSGISVGTIGSGASVQVSYAVLVNAVPSVQPLQNTASVSFTSGTFTGTSQTNTVSVPVYQPRISVAKSANTTASTIGDTILYTLLVTNSGNYNASVTLTDAIPAGSTFLENSVVINGVSQPGASPAAGIFIGTVSPQSPITLTFQTVVASLPTPAQLTDQAAAAISFILPDGRVRTANTSSNVLSIPVSAPNVSVSKTANRSTAIPGDSVLYTLTVLNNGIETVNNVVVSDPIPSGSQFTAGSVTLNGSAVTNGDPSLGIPIGSIAAGSGATITFRVTVSSPLPSPPQLTNQARVSFTSGAFSGVSVSNPVTVNVNAPVLAVSKTANPIRATVGDMVTYSVAVANNGNIAAAATLTDNIPTGSALVPNSVVVNSTPVPGASPVAGLSIGSIAPGAVVQTTFQVVITSVPLPPQLTDQANISFSFQPPDGRIVNGNVSSNIVTIPVSSPNVLVTKSASATDAVPGDTITYTITATNRGIETVTDVRVTDTIPAGSTFVSGSVIVNGATLPSASPLTGIPVGSIAAGASTTVTFSVSVNSLPQPPQLSDQATVSFTSGTLNFTSLSNTVVVPVYQPIINLVKTANTSQATVGDTVVYTLTAQNTGNLAATATFTDAIPSGSSFVPNSVTVNGLPVAGATPQTGVSVGSIAAGASVSLTFQVIINAVPVGLGLLNQGSATFTFQPPDGRTLNGNVQSNPVFIPVSNPNVAVTKTVNQTAVAFGDTITYTITAVNNDITPVTGAVFVDPIADGTTFIANSVQVNGVTIPGANIATGVAVGSIPAASSVTVTFQATVTSLPASGLSTDQATVSFNSGAFAGQSISNPVSLPVLQPILNVTNTLSADRATVGNTLGFVITVTNTGNTPAQTVVLDLLSSSLSLNQNSVLVNGAPIPGADPSSGINIGSVAPGTTVTVTFSAVVISVPPGSILTSQANVNYTFQLPDGRTLTGSGSAQPVSIPISSPNVTVTKASDVAVAVVGDSVPYIITAFNNGLDPVTNVIVTDTIPFGTAFVPGSVTINGTPVASANPQSGIPVGTLGAGGGATIRFLLNVQSLPSPASITNEAKVSFTSGAFNGFSVSTPVTIPVYQPIVTVAKSAGTGRATVGDTVTYTLSVTNSGNIGVDTVLSDPIPAGAVFVSNSVVINGTAAPGSDPNVGIPLGIIGAATTVALTFQAVITSLPASGTLVNQATAAFSYQPPDGRVLTGNAVSPTVTVSVSSPDVDVTKTASATDAVVGDTITYTVIATNNGISQVVNAVVSDPPPPGTSFVPGSVTVNGASVPAASPVSGIPVGTIAVGGSAAVTFQLSVVSLPQPPQITNQANVSFTSGALTSSSQSDPVTLPVYQPIISLTKTASTVNTQIGSTLLYTLALTNTGNIAVIPVLSDNIPAGSELLPNSVIVNGIPIPGASPVTGITLGSLAPSSSIVVSFQTLVSSLPTPPILTDLGQANFTYSPPDGRVLSGSVTSNTVNVSVSAPNIQVTKTSSLAAAVVGDTIRYTLSITNSGVDLVTDTVVTDTIPAGTSFVPGSVLIDGVAFPNASPVAGIAIGNVAPGNTFVVSFQTSVQTLPQPPLLTDIAAVTFTSGTFTGTALSDPLIVPVFQPLIALTKTSSTLNASVGDTLTYTITAVNSGNIAAALTISDNIPAGSSFLANSVSIAGSPQPGLSIETGVLVGSVLPGGTVSVTFQTLINSLPNPQVLIDQASGSFTFQPPDGRTVSGSAVSNSLSISVSSPDVSIVKGTAATDAIIGDIITYTLAVSNHGISTASNIVVSDMIAAGSSFVNGSVTINGTAFPDGNPGFGIAIGTLTSGAVTTVTFQVRVDSLPTPPQLSNQASVSFTSGVFTGSSTSNTVTVPVFQPILTAVKTSSTNNATIGDIITYTVVVSNTGNIAASTTVSDNIPNGSVFLPNTVSINGIAAPGASPVTGIPTPAIPPGQSATVTFQVLVSSIPAAVLLVDQAEVNYRFNAPDGRETGGSHLSNIVEVAVSPLDITLSKSVSSPFATTGDTLTYELVILNEDADTVQDARLLDTLPEDIEFVTGSVQINGTAIAAGDPRSGIPLPPLEANTKTVISFEVRIAATEQPGPRTNQARLLLTNEEEASAILSNAVTVAILQPVLKLTKTANRESVQPGQSITYTIIAENTGNTGAFGMLTDSLPPELSFVPGSVTVNGVPGYGVSPGQGITLGAIAPGERATAVFSVLVVRSSESGALINQASLAYSYQLPNGRNIHLEATSPSVSVKVNPTVEGALSAVLSTTVSAVALGDAVPYQLILVNDGGTVITDVILADYVPDGAIIDPGSLRINGSPPASSKPGEPLFIGSLQPEQTVNLSYTVNVQSLPVGGRLNNNVQLRYADSNGASEITSNTVTVAVYDPQLAVKISTENTEAIAGEILTYTIQLNNFGNVTTEATLQNFIPAGTLFIPGTIQLNGQSLSEANPAVGVNLRSVEPGQSLTLTYQVSVSETPPPGYIVNQATFAYSFMLPGGRAISGTLTTNTVTIPVVFPLLELVKKVDTTEASVGDTLTFIIQVTNKGGISAQYPLFTDLLPQGLVYVPNSLTIQEKAQPGANPGTGTALPDIAPGETLNLTLQALIREAPADGTFSNLVTIEYTSRRSAGEAIQESAQSNTVGITVIAAVPKLTLSSSALRVGEEDTLSFTVHVENIGNTPLEELLLTAPFAAEDFLLLRTVTMNSVPLPHPKLLQGIPLGRLDPNHQSVIVFSFDIETALRPYLIAQAILRYQFCYPDGRVEKQSASSNTIFVEMADFDGSVE